MRRSPRNGWCRGSTVPQAAPDIELRFDISSAAARFRHDDIDVAIRFGTGKYPGLVAERLFDNVIIPVCSPKVLSPVAVPAAANRPRDLLQHTLVHIEWSRQGVTWPNWRMWMAAAGIEDFDDSRCVLFEDSSHAVQAAIEGNVVALGDFAMVANDLSSGRLIRPFELGIKVPATSPIIWSTRRSCRRSAHHRVSRLDRQAKRRESRESAVAAPFGPASAKCWPESEGAKVRDQAALRFGWIRARSISSSAICTALSAAPLRRLSETIHIDRPFSMVWSSRMREMKVASSPAESSGVT